MALVPVLLAVFRDGNMAVGAVLFVFVSMTMALVNSERRATGTLGALTGTLVATWSMSAIIAVGMHYYGFL